MGTGLLIPVQHQDAQAIQQEKHDLQHTKLHVHIFFFPPLSQQKMKANIVH